jgi:hypothetical protein
LAAKKSFRVYSYFIKWGTVLWGWSFLYFEGSFDF